jgi:hypothetical protein
MRTLTALAAAWVLVQSGQVRAQCGCEPIYSTIEPPIVYESCPQPTVYSAPVPVEKYTPTLTSTRTETFTITNSSLGLVKFDSEKQAAYLLDSSDKDSKKWHWFRIDNLPTDPPNVSFPNRN